MATARKKKGGVKLFLLEHLVKSGGSVMRRAEGEGRKRHWGCHIEGDCGLLTRLDNGGEDEIFGHQRNVVVSVLLIQRRQLVRLTVSRALNQVTADERVQAKNQQESGEMKKKERKMGFLRRTPDHAST